MRLIDADELIKMLQDTIDFNMKHNTFFKSFSMQHILYILENMKTVDPVKHGRWIQAGQPNENSETLYRCSICGYLEVVPLYDTNNYCGNCGAKMDQDTGGDNNGSGEAKKE